jgi:RNA-binding protein
MRVLNGTERKYLRGLAHSLKPIVQMGKSGITEALISSINQALDDHELIKMKFLEFKSEKKSLARTIESKSGSQLIGMIGNVAIFYREQSDEKKKKIKMP